MLCLHFRTWILLEAFFAERNNIPYEIFLTHSNRSRLRDQSFGSVPPISILESTCWTLRDRDCILRMVAEKFGFEEFNDIVGGAFAKSLSSALDRPIKSSIVSGKFQQDFRNGSDVKPESIDAGLQTDLKENYSTLPLDLV